MSIDRRVKKLNRLFVELGTIPYGEFVGQPIFQYRRGHELRMPYKKHGEGGWSTTPGGLYMPTTEYELGYQTSGKDNTWIIAKWIEAGFTEDQWREKFPNLGYPKHGYFTGYQPLAEGKNPDEEWTLWMVSHIKYQMEMNYREHLEQVEKFYGRKEKARDRTIEDMVTDALHMNVPGKRGGLVSYPQTRHTR